MMRFSFVLLSFVLLYACAGPKIVVQEDAPADLEITQLDTLVVTAPEPESEDSAKAISEPSIYRNSHPMSIDIVHTTLHLAFDWDKEAVIGKALIKITSKFFPVNEFFLDAKGFSIHSLKETSGLPVEFTYDQSQLLVSMEKSITREDTIELSIDYTAFPSPEKTRALPLLQIRDCFLCNLPILFNKSGPRGKLNSIHVGFLLSISQMNVAPRKCI